MGFTHWAPDTEHSFRSLGEKSLFDGILYEMGHAFANSDMYFFVLTYIAIALGAVAGPGLAMALFGGQLEEGEDCQALVHSGHPHSTTWVYKGRYQLRQHCFR